MKHDGLLISGEIVETFIIYRNSKDRPGHMKLICDLIQTRHGGTTDPWYHRYSAAILKKAEIASPDGIYEASPTVT